MPDDSRRVAELEAENAAMRRTIEVLSDRVEQRGVDTDAGRVSLHRAIASLENEVRQRARALEVSEAHYRALYDSSPDAILTIDSECCIRAFNWTAELLFGKSGDDLLGAQISSLLDPASGAALTGLLWTGFVGVGETDVILPDGRHMSFSVARLDDNDTLLVLRDVTQGRRLEAEMLRSRRMASLGRLSASLAHEINNPLAVIQGRLELLQARPEADPERLRRQLDVLQEHCRRIGRITRNLQSFAVPRPPLRERLVVSEALADAISLAGRRLERVPVETLVERADLEVFADRDQLTQLLTNLLLMGAEASPAGCAVTLQAVEEAGGLRITVEDQGRGLRQELLDELRSPYSNDIRMVDPGLGLSLAISWAIAQDHGGSLTAENRHPAGTRYQVFIPPRQEAHVAADGLTSQDRDPLDILVVDDDQMLCETTTWMLAGEGHRIETVHSAEEALTRLNRRQFDVLVIDVRLPGMSGEELVDAVEARWPGAGQLAIFASGGIMRPRRRNPYLQKPFTREQLLGAIRAVRAEVDSTT